MSNQNFGTQPLRRAALFSGLSLGFGFGYSLIIRLLSMYVLTRIFLPEAFGLMSMVSTILIGLALFSDLGVRVSVVQHERGDDVDFLNTAWTLQILRGIILWLAACLLAWPAAYWRPDPAPDLLWLLPLIAFSTVIDGFTSTNLFTYSRHISQGRESVIDAMSHTFGVAVTIIWAHNDRHIRALAAGSLVTCSTKTLLSHLIIPGLRNRLCWNRDAFRELAHVAKWVYLGTMFTYVATYADRLVVGLVSLEQLGVYHFAREFADLPASLMAAIAGRLIFPIYSRIMRSESDLSGVFPQVHLLTGGISALLLAGILATGPTLIQCLLAQSYQKAAWILPLLVCGSWFRVLASNAGSVFFAKGLVRYSAYCNIAKVVSLLIFMPLGYFLDDFRGIILGFVAGDIVRYGLTVRLLARDRFFVLRYDLLWTLFIAITAFLASEIGRQVWLIPTHGASMKLAYIPRLLVEGGLVVLCWGSVVLVCRQKGHFRKPPAASLAT